MNFAKGMQEDMMKAAMGTTLLTIGHEGGSIQALAWSPDGSRLASADAMVRIWQA